MERSKKKFKLAVITSKSHPGLGKFAERKLTNYFDFDVLESKEQVESLPSPTQYDACFVMNMGTPVTFDGAAAALEALILKSPSLKWVHTMTAGVEYLLREPLIKASQHMTFTNTRGAYNRPLAEFVALSILYFAKKIPLFAKSRAQHKFEKRPVELAFNIDVGIIGYGSIGRTTAKLLKDAFNAKIHAISADPVSEEEKKGLASVGGTKDILTMLPKVDYVVVILPHTPNTHHLINMTHFKAMKPSATFINIGRGATVVESDLVEALKTGIIAGAGLDVFEVAGSFRRMRYCIKKRVGGTIAGNESAVRHGKCAVDATLGGHFEQHARTLAGSL